MKILLLALLCFIAVANSYSQATTNTYGRVDVTITKAKKPKRIYAEVEIKSAFTGGDSAWVKATEERINQSLRYKNGAKKGTYLVTVHFIADKQGSLSDILCRNDPGFGMGEAVKRAIIKSGRWVPAPQPVREYRR